MPWGRADGAGPPRPVKRLPVQSKGAGSPRGFGRRRAKQPISNTQRTLQKFINNPMINHHFNRTFMAGAPSVGRLLLSVTVFFL